MSRSLLKVRLTLFLLRHHARALAGGRLSPAQAVRSLRRQLIVSAQFRDAKYSQVGDKIFIDPFAPYFPSIYCETLFDNNSAEGSPPRPNFAQMSITNRCPCRCVHCHVENTQGPDLPRETILNAIGQIAGLDFPLLFFVGGEPLARFDDLIDFVAAARTHMDTRIFTSGVGGNPERLRKLRHAGLEGICVSLDHHEAAVHNRKRNHPTAFRDACAAIQEAANQGFYVSVVCCTTSSMARSGAAFRVVDLAESLGAHSVQLNEIRPVGRAASAPDQDLFLTEGDKQILIDYHQRTNRSRRPISIVMPWFNEEPHKFGCTATAGQQAYVDAAGNVQPCPLLKVSLGNIEERGFDEIWKAFRSHCSHPVRTCLVHHLADELHHTTDLPLPPARTYELWGDACRLEPTDLFRRLNPGSTQVSQ